MPASQRPKVLSVRLPEPEVRRVKSIAARRGITLQEAVRQALEAWALESRNPPLEPLEALRGSLADFDVSKVMREDREIERKHEERLLGRRLH
ncbi:MAG: ribbon-helix-helix protein, CopG family [Bryobacteraceae bacterium]